MVVWNWNCGDSGGGTTEKVGWLGWLVDGWMDGDMRPKTTSPNPERDLSTPFL